jgi:hypothetical protein
MRRHGVLAVAALSLFVAAVSAGSADGSSDRNTDGAILQALFDRHPRT